jgi:hypothetical protein
MEGPTILERRALTNKMKNTADAIGTNKGRREEKNGSV